MRSARNDRGVIRSHSILVLSLLLACPAFAQPPRLDERPAEPGTWGYRPDNGARVADGPAELQLAAAAGPDVGDRVCPRRQFRERRLPSRGHRVQRALSAAEPSVRAAMPGATAARTRKAATPTGARRGPSRLRTTPCRCPCPSRQELIARIPKTHPRLFLRPENLDRLRELARGELKDKYLDLVKECDRILANPPSTQEPPKYPPGTDTKSEEWRDDLVGQPRLHDQGPQQCRDARLHPAARRSGEVRAGGQANPPRMRQMGPQGQHRLPLQRRSRHAVQLPILADLHVRQRPADAKRKRTSAAR